MPKPVVHMSRVRPNAFGGQTTGTLCGRFRVLSAGMNLTEKHEEVTCKLCLRVIPFMDFKLVKRDAVAKAEA